MGQIIQFFSNLILMLLVSFICISVMASAYRRAEADEYKADVIAELENSNFNEQVKNGCISQAKKEGYELCINDCIYDEEENIRLAEVVLIYSYEIPLLGLSRERQVRGIAR